MVAVAVFSEFGWHLESALDRSEESAFRPDPNEIVLVQQQFSDEVDMNTIARRYGITRDTPLGDPGGVYADFTGVHDYDSAMAAVRRADARFMQLPPDVRERFKNSPSQLIAAANSMSEAEFLAAVLPAAAGDGEGAPARSGEVPPT